MRLPLKCLSTDIRGMQLALSLTLALVSVDATGIHMSFDQPTVDAAAIGHDNLPTYRASDWHWT